MSQNVHTGTSRPTCAERLYFTKKKDALGNFLVQADYTHMDQTSNATEEKFFQYFSEEKTST